MVKDYIHYVDNSACLSSGNEKKDCGNFGWKDCSKALLRLRKKINMLIVIGGRSLCDMKKRGA